jgi:hypothetical protein
MIGKHLLIALRSLKKNLLYSLLVIVGLAEGITTFLSTILQGEHEDPLIRAE